MNRITSLFGIQYPIIQGGMVWCSGWRLASAVSNAGGLGLLGAGSMHPETLREHIRKCRAATDRPFGVNIPLMYPQIEEIMAIVAEEGVKIVFTSAPSTMAAKIPSPVPIPPAAIKGKVVALRTAGIKQKVVVSSRPLCPPASKPSATTASTPASSHFIAKREEETT